MIEIILMRTLWNHDTKTWPGNTFVSSFNGHRWIGLRTVLRVLAFELVIVVIRICALEWPQPWEPNLRDNLMFTILETHEVDAKYVECGHTSLIVHISHRIIYTFILRTVGIPGHCVLWIWVFDGLWTCVWLRSWWLISAFRSLIWGAFEREVLQAMIHCSLDSWL